MSDITYTSTFNDIDYTSSFVTGEPTEICSVFYPTTQNGAAAYGWASGRWPVVIWVINSGFNSGQPSTEIPPLSWLHPLIDSGFAVVTATTAQARDEVQGGPNGAGTYRPPELAGVGNDYDQWDDPLFPNTCKSAVHLVQWARENAATYQFDPNAVVMGGRSGGSLGPLFVGHGLDWATYTGATGQFRSGISSRPNAIIPMQIAASYDAFVDSQVLRILPDRAAPLTTTAATKADALDQILLRAEPLYFAFNETAFPNVLDFSGTMPTYQVATNTVSFTDLTVDANGNATLADSITASHDGWQHAIYWRRMIDTAPSFHPQNSRIGWPVDTAPSDALVPGVLTFPTLTDIFVDVAEWLPGALGLQAPNLITTAKPIRAAGTKLQVFQPNETLPIESGGTGQTTAFDALTALGGLPATFVQHPYELLAADTVQADKNRTYIKTLTEPLELKVDNALNGVELTLLFTRPWLLTLPEGTEIFGQYDEKNIGVKSVITFKVLEATEPFYQAWIRNYKVQSTGLVFRQTLGNYFADEAAARDTAAATPEEADLYSILGDMEDYRDRSTGRFHFRYVVNSGGQTREWWFYQDSNPLDTYQVVEGYELDQVVNGFVTTNLGGLCRSGYLGLLLDGQPGFSPDFSVNPIQGVSASVGATTLASVSGILPGDPGVNSADYIELYVL